VDFVARISCNYAIGLKKTYQPQPIAGSVAESVAVKIIDYQGLSMSD